MLDAIIRFSLTQRVFVILLAVLLVILGARAWLKIPIDAFPDISPTQVKIILKAPGMTPEEIEQQVTRPIETELLGIPNQQMLRSTTKYAITDITLDFVDGTDIYWARQQVSERLANLWDSLPAELDGGIAPMSTPLSEMLMFTLENPALSLMQRRELLDWEVRPALRAVPGVADVNVLGGYARTFQITPRPGQMAAIGIGVVELEALLQANNLNSGAGRIVEGNDTLIVRTEGRLDSIESIGALVVASRDGIDYRLADVAEVGIGHLARYGAVTRNSKETAEALVIALKDSNTAQVVAGVKAKLAELEPTLPPGTELNVFYDRSVLIATAVGTITIALLQAVVLVIALLTLFLGDLRASLVVSLALPLSALATFLWMSGFGLSANLMSLGGLVIAIGMLVDASVVVVENVATRLADKPGLPRLHLIYRAAKDVAPPVVSGTLIVIIVFSPLLTMTGLEGKLFTPVALTIVFAMLSALALSLTVIPVLASVLLAAGSDKTPRFVRYLQGAYHNSLQVVLDRPAPLLGSLVLMLLASASLFAFTGKTFMPTLDEGDIIVQLEKSPSISLGASVALDRQIETALLQSIPEIRQIVARTGSDELGLDPMGLNETDIFMELHHSADWQVSSKEELISRMRAVLEQFPGINFGFTQPIQMRVSEMLTGSSGDLAIKIFGNDMSTLAELTGKVQNVLQDTPGAIDIQAAVIEGGQFLNIRLKQQFATHHGMTVANLGRQVRAQLEGTVTSEIIEGKRRFPLLIANRGTPVDPASSIAALKQQPISLPDGAVAPLGAIADISFREGPLLIERERGNRFGVITSNVTGRDIVGLVEELQTRIDEKIKLPTGYAIEFGGEFENQARATRNLLLVVPAALLLILVILFGTFRSMPLAGLILANVPFAMMGGIGALFASGEYLSVPASVGFIALLGVAVLNGVVMVSHFEQSRSVIPDHMDRVCGGAVKRLRPVLMTATTAMFGLLPLIFASGPGAETQRPLAIVVTGGLLTSTLTTLYALPVVYLWLQRRNG
ncbi:CusA/CzcA family heavy metal efflux RND transporter [Seongchinamella sediminis]|uniref:CusA/CzcA family heavy metal efflux RND transporter n=1 Tax=Seongchinamella sediminis TaxID=2283635 RepID=A0A3L7E2F6_9GAMM|nr:CusA/CzcA family heavy metal efflux RND transporter [Seongchinamella sediminis]RLQ22543.1 CusA/CzcA family heavy metal efflux RND transporter [Seongchinamella sediminis]